MATERALADGMAATATATTTATAAGPRPLPWPAAVLAIGALSAGLWLGLGWLAAALL